MLAGSTRFLCISGASLNFAVSRVCVRGGCRCDKQKSVKMRVRSCESPKIFPPAAGQRTRYARRPKSGTPVASRVGVTPDPPCPPSGRKRMVYGVWRITASAVRAKAYGVWRIPTPPRVLRFSDRRVVRHALDIAPLCLPRQTRVQHTGVCEVAPEWSPSPPGG